MVDTHTRIVFTTAFDQYAIDGYRVNALDYLLKPISYADFLQAANKAVKWFELLQQPQEEIESIFVKNDYKLLINPYFMRLYDAKKNISFFIDWDTRM